jgi:coiled-coil and C2 domain-containing protein 2A
MPTTYVLIANHNTQQAPSLLGASNNEVQDNRELNRRNAVSKTKIFTRIFFNGKEVCQSASRSLPQDFVVQLGQIFPIQIVQWPETLTLQIIEGGTLKTSILAEVKLPLCEATKTLADCNRLEPIEFQSEVKISHDHSGLGSGINFPTNLDGSKISQEFVKGRMFARVGWAKRSDGTILAPPADQWCPRTDTK